MLNSACTQFDSAFAIGSLSLELTINITGNIKECNNVLVATKKWRKMKSKYQTRDKVFEHASVRTTMAAGNWLQGPQQYGI